MKKVISLFLLMFILAMNVTYADVHPYNAAWPTYQLKIKNQTNPSPNVFTFELWVSSVSNIPLEIDYFQAGITFNNDIRNGGTITATLDYTGSVLPLDMRHATTAPATGTSGSYIISNTNPCYRLAGKNGAFGVPVTSGAPDVFLVKVIFTNTVPFMPSLMPNLTWNFANNPYPTKMFAVGVTFGNVTLPITDTTVLGWHTNENPTFALNVTSGSSSPFVYNVTGGGSYCAGTIPTGVSLGLSGSQLAYSYQLYKDNVSEGLPKAGTGAALTWNNLTAGVYTVKATDTANTAMNGSATIIAPLTPIQQTITISASSNPSFQGDPVTFTATVTPTVAGQSHKWYYNATLQYTLLNSYSLVSANGGVVYCEAVPTGCYTGAQSNNITMQVYPYHNITGGGVYCAGTTPTGISVSMSGSLSTLSYQLYKNNVAEGAPLVGNGAALSWNNLTAGTYTVKATNGSWTSNISGSAIVTSITSPPTPVVSVNNSCYAQFTITNAVPGATFNWTPAITNLNYVPAGTYTVTQTLGTCTSNASANVVAAPIGVTNQTVTIVASANPSVQGQVVTFTATATPAAAGQIFDWYVNTVWQNTTGTNTFSKVPSNGDVVSCEAVPTGCYTGGISNNITMTVIHTVTGGGTYCAGYSPTGISVNLSGSDIPYSYQLYKDNVAEGAPIVGTGAALSWNNLTVGVYTVKAINGNSVLNMFGSVTVTANATPVTPIVTVNNTCNNSAFTITNGATGATFNWVPAISNLNNVPAGTYTVTQTVGTCSSFASANVTAALIAPTVQAITIVASANPSVQGQTVIYMASATPAATGQIFNWYVNNVLQNTNGIDTFSYVPANGDVVYCTAVSIACFTGGLSNNITMTVNPITNTWLGLTSDWSNFQNWSLGIVPLANHDVIIPQNPANGANFPIINTPAVCHVITIQSGAQLIQNSTLTIGSEVFIQHELTAGTWHFVSSPIDNATTYAFSNANPINFGQSLFFQTYNEAWILGSGTSPWVDVTNGSGETMSPGKGYKVWSDNNHIITMEGTQLNSANIVTPVMYTPAASYPGYNLIGNSYPSAIDIHGFNTWGVNMDASIYAWDGAQYLFQNTLFGTLGFIIAPNQGFMVKANAAGAMFTIPATAKTFGGTFLKSTVSDVLKLKVSGNGYNDAAYINFNSNATANYDGQFDVEKIFGIDAAPQFYSTITNKNLSINTLPSLTSPVVVPMSLNVGANTTYTITASEMNSFANGTTITLEDTKTNTFTNLMQQAVYTFTASPADNANRFKLHFGVNGINENGNGNISIYSNSNVIYVNNNSKEVVKKIVVMNVLGQEILNKKAANTTVNTITMDVASAYYVVKVITENKVYTEKVYVR